MRVTRRTVSLVALVTGGLAAGAGAYTWGLHRGVDPVYDDDEALAGWADRLAHPPASLAVPPGIALPESSTGLPLRQAAALPVGRSLRVADPDSLDKATLEDWKPYARVGTTSALLLVVSKRTVQLEGRDLLPVPADPTRGFDARYKHSEAELELLRGVTAPLDYAFERARTLREALGQQVLAEDLLVLADRDLPSRLLAEVFYNAGSASLNPRLTAVRAGKVVDMGVTSHATRGEWLLRVTILPQAFELALPHERGIIECKRGHVEERDDARFITITRRGEASDFEALTDCVRRVEKVFAHELEYAVAPGPAVTIQTVVSTVDAVRKDAATDLKTDFFTSAMRSPSADPLGY